MYLGVIYKWNNNNNNLQLIIMFIWVIKSLTSKAFNKNNLGANRCQIKSKSKHFKIHQRLDYHKIYFNPMIWFPETFKINLHRTLKPLWNNSNRKLHFIFTPADDIWKYRATSTGYLQGTKQTKLLNQHRMVQKYIWTMVILLLTLFTIFLIS